MEHCSHGDGRSQTERFHTETKDNNFHKTVHFYRGMNGVWVLSLIIDLFSGRMLSRLYLFHENCSGRQFNFRNGIALILFYSSDGLCCLEGLFFPPVLFFAYHIPFCYLCSTSLTVSDLLPLRSSFWPLGRQMFYFYLIFLWLILKKIGKSFTPHKLLFALSRGDALPLCNSVMPVSEIKENVRF